jgi:parallel beta-helix repeat protein
MLLSSTSTRLATAAIAVLLLALPTGALAQTASNRRPMAHAAKARNSHKRVRCHTRSRKHGKRRCVKAHKTSHKRAHASRAHRPSPPAPRTPTQAPSAPSDPAGPVQAPVLTITGTTYYVSASGSDSNSGTSPGSAWRTVQRVDRASLQPGDGVLFEGGSTFSDEALMPGASGTSGSPIVFGSYGQGNATLPQGVWFRGHNGLAFEHLTIGPEGGVQGTGENITIEWCAIGNDSLAINAAAGSSNSNNKNWTIDDNTIEHTGNSGMLLEGENFTVSGNTIANTGLDNSIPYGKHGIYLKVSNATVTGNTITNFSEDGISVRYRNSTVADNYISGGPIGIAWFQYDTISGTSHWTGNTIVGTTAAGFYVSDSNIGGATRESFVIEHNTLQPASGVFMNLAATTGSYAVQENTQI